MPTGPHGWGFALAATFALCLAGCATPPAGPRPMPMVVAETREVLPTTYLVRAAGHETSAAPSAPLGLSELLDLARQQNPDLAMAAARVTEAQGQFGQAGPPPHPALRARRQ